MRYDDTKIGSSTAPRHSPKYGKTLVCCMSLNVTMCCTKPSTDSVSLGKPTSEICYYYSFYQFKPKKPGSLLTI